MLKVNLTHFENRISEVILKRAHRYFLEGRVTDVREITGGEFEVVVEGTTDYEVSLVVEANGDILYSECSCPYDMGPVCKHEAAAYYEIRKILQERRLSNSVPSAELTKILEAMPRKELISLLLEQAQKDQLLREKLIGHGKPAGDGSYISGVERAIEKIEDNYSDRYGFIGYAETMDYADDMEELLDKRSDVEDPVLKAEVAWRILRKAVGALKYADDSGGSFELLIDSAIETIRQAAEEAAKEEREAGEKLLERIVVWSADKVFDEWKYISHNLLFAALELADVPDFRKRLMEWIMELFRKADEYDRRDLLDIQMELIVRGGSEEELNRFLDEYVQYSNVREEAIRRAANAGAFKEAIELARQGEEQDSEDAGLMKKWRAMRFNLHKETGQKREAEKLAWMLLVDGELNYYGELRELSADSGQLYETAKQKLKDAGTWRAERVFLSLIDQENDLPEMMARSWAKPSSITSYGKRLAGEYPEEVAEIYETYIMDTAKRSSNRGQYRELCNILKAGIGTIGKVQVESLIVRLEADYRRRPAMLDELERLKREIHS